MPKGSFSATVVVPATERQDDILDESAALLNEHIDREAATKLCVLDIEADAPNDLLEQRALQSSSVALIFLSLYIGVFLAALDGTVVATLLAHISSEFHEFRSVSWIATAYLIAVAACQPLYGKLSDILGRKTLLLFSNATFAIGCVLCGIANNIWFLVFARIIAGIGGAGLTSLSSITLNDLVPLRQRSLLQGIGSVLYNAGASLGGLFGGFITDALGWRWAFFLQVPFIVVSSVAIYLNLKSKPRPVSSNSESETAVKLSRIDFAGSITLVLSLVLYLLGLSIGGNYVSWLSFPVFVAFFLGSIFLAAFIYVELYIAMEPVIPITLLKDRTIFGASFTNWLIMMINYTQLFFLPIYFIAIRGISPTQAGTNIIPNFLGSAFGAIFSGTVMRTTGRYWWITMSSAFIITFGSILINTYNLTTPKWAQVLYIMVTGLGFGGLLNCTLIAMVAAVPPELQAVTTAIQYGFRGTGSTVGVAIASAIFQNVLGKKLDQYIIGPDKSDIISRVTDSIEDIDYIPGEYKADVVHAYLDAFHGVFRFVIFLAAAVVITCGMMKEHVLHRTFDRK
ncbi:major facilitator superfamily domain-containing protein [Lipomyces chichibuensis]|uniref:major facilitator superfamily domain-containing protein n=1 Tax=Lipomyces chichibuensis TaxID=1546026 RepID=UPI0033433848